MNICYRPDSYQLKLLLKSGSVFWMLTSLTSKKKINFKVIFLFLIFEAIYFPKLSPIFIGSSLCLFRKYEIGFPISKMFTLSYNGRIRSFWSLFQIKTFGITISILLKHFLLRILLQTFSFTTTISNSRRTLFSENCAQFLPARILPWEQVVVGDIAMVISNSNCFLAGFDATEEWCIDIGYNSCLGSKFGQKAHSLIWGLSYDASGYFLTGPAMPSFESTN